MNIRVAAVSFVALFVCSSCASGYKPNDPYAKPVAPGEAEAKLGAWFRCDECMGGQLRRVQELGDTVVPTLESNLDQNVPNLGDHKAVYQQRCERLNIRITGRGLDAMDCNEYVARFEQQLKNRYEKRAFEALLAIRTPAACSVIGAGYCTTIPPFPKVRVLHTTDRSLHDPGP